jgi:hypothetical protein
MKIENQKSLPVRQAGKIENSGKQAAASAGQAMITAVIFFVFISLTILIGLSAPIMRQVGIVSDLIRSRDSFFLAEAGMEDVIYRLRNGLPHVATNQELFLDNYIATTNITDDIGGKIVSTEANWAGHVRKVETRLSTGVGIAFNYAVQTGTGGFVFGNNAGVNGNVYSNGNILGSNGAFITGSTFAANSIPLTADQSNLTPATPANWITFRDTSGSQDMAQRFQVSTTSQINKVQFYIKKIGNPGNATVRIVSDNANNPSTNTLTSASLSASLITTNYSLVDVIFGTQVELTEGVGYWIVVDNSSQSTSHHFIIGANDTYESGVAKVGQYNGTWNDTNPSGLDAYFTASLGGVDGVIENVLVGSSTASTGDARAHTVNSSTVYGNLYCQAGSGNNKSCDTSQPDPSAQGFPISDGVIAQWKQDAESGGVINGDLVIDDEEVSLGPTKITGNLLIENNAVVTITGTIYVVGTITFTNNIDVNLFSGYDSDSGVILSDNRIVISNNAVFGGSGTEGSYILVLTTSDCPTSASCNGLYALDVGNNAGTVVLNAQKGTLNFSNNAGAKSATAYKINLSNNAVITYESGLVDTNFSSGPSGGWDIISWKEVE